jgi:hypothetical protein
MVTQFVSLDLIPLPQQPLLIHERPKFDAAFLDQRMRRHREWQKREAWHLAVEITREVLLLDPLEEKQ